LDGITDLFGFFFLGQRQRRRCWWAWPGRAGPDRTRGWGRRDERYVTGLWISNDESSFLDEVYGLVWFSFRASVKEAAVWGPGGGMNDVTRLWIFNDQSSCLDEVYGPVWFSFWASVKEAAVGGEG